MGDELLLVWWCFSMLVLNVIVEYDRITSGFKMQHSIWKMTPTE